MNKSTPLNQLPIHNSPIQEMRGAPEPDHVPEDDATIQDVLNKLNNEIATKQTVQDYNNLAMEATQPQMQPYAYSEQDAEYGYDYQRQVAEPAQPDLKNKLINDIMSFNDTVKCSIIAGILFIFLYYIPVENLVFKYVSIQHIPYSDVIVKSLLMVTLMFVVQQLV